MDFEAFYIDEEKSKEEKAGEGAEDEEAEEEEAEDRTETEYAADMELIM